MMVGLQVAGWEVVCEDTVLFPEGGGQNSDQGQLAGRRVLEVPVSWTGLGPHAGPPGDEGRGDRRALRHRGGGGGGEQGGAGGGLGEEVLPPLPPSARWDHMQQHSGQHLLSAVLERRQSTNTLSWWMAETSRDKVMVPGCQGGGLLDEGLNLESQL